MLDSPQGRVPSVTIQHYSSAIDSDPYAVPFLPATSSCQNWKEAAISQRVVWEVFFGVGWSLEGVILTSTFVCERTRACAWEKYSSLLHLFVVVHAFIQAVFIFANVLLL